MEGWGRTHRTPMWWQERTADIDGALKNQNSWTWWAGARVKSTRLNMSAQMLIETRHTFHRPPIIPSGCTHAYTLAAAVRWALLRHIHNHHKYKLAIVAAGGGGGGGGTEIEADWLIWRLNSKCCFYSALKFTDWIWCSPAQILK